MLFKSGSLRTEISRVVMWKKVLAAVFGVIVGYWLIDDFNPDTLKGKRVLITGASAGIGEQMAYHYAKMGANVVVTARTETKLQQVVSRCRELGRSDGIFHYISADMSNLTSTDRVIRETVSLLGGIDFLVLNHIIVIPLGMWKGSEDNLTRMDKIVDVNYKSYVHLTSHALPYLEDSKGSIVVVSSLAGKVAQPFSGVYSSTKFALDGFFGSLRQEFALRNCEVSVTLCVIGLVATDSAIKELKNFRQFFLLDTVKAAEPPDAAYAIIRGGALRLREIYYPYMETRILTMLRDWLPKTVDYINRFMYTVS